ncbi:hypothetical protein [Nostoc sp. NMS7]
MPKNSIPLWVEFFILIIRWATLEQWKAIPQADLQTIEDKFI